jgi:hypothetical protein
MFESVARIRWLLRFISFRSECDGLPNAFNAFIHAAAHSQLSVHGRKRSVCCRCGVTGFLLFGQEASHLFADGIKKRRPKIGRFTGEAGMNRLLAARGRSAAVGSSSPVSTQHPINVAVAGISANDLKSTGIFQGFSGEILNFRTDMCRAADSTVR